MTDMRAKLNLFPPMMKVKTGSSAITLRSDLRIRQLRAHLDRMRFLPHIRGIGPKT